MTLALTSGTVSDTLLVYRTCPLLQLIQSRNFNCITTQACLLYFVLCILCHAIVCIWTEHLLNPTVRSHRKSHHRRRSVSPPNWLLSGCDLEPLSDYSGRYLGPTGSWCGYLSFIMVCRGCPSRYLTRSNLRSRCRWKVLRSTICWCMWKVHTCSVSNSVDWFRGDRLNRPLLSLPAAACQRLESQPPT